MNNSQEHVLVNSGNETRGKPNKYLSYFLAGGTILLLMLLFFLKDDLVNYTGNTIKNNAGIENNSRAINFIDSAYNYATNHQDYRLTFLEFGSTNCSACKRMESVMKDIMSKHAGTVKVEFLHVQSPKNEFLLKYYGIAVIPTQVLLDNQGKEFFRHTGYYSTEELSGIITRKLLDRAPAWH